MNTVYSLFKIPSKFLFTILHSLRFERGFHHNKIVQRLLENHLKILNNFKLPRFLFIHYVFLSGNTKKPMNYFLQDYASAHVKSLDIYCNKKLPKFGKRTSCNRYYFWASLKKSDTFQSNIRSAVY